MVDFECCTVPIWKTFCTVICGTFWTATALYVIIITMIFKLKQHDIGTIDSSLVESPLETEAAQHNAVVAHSLFESWKTESFSDFIIMDQQNGEDAVCPNTHPNELLLNVQPGSMHDCDCLERAGEKCFVNQDISCVNKGEHTSDCKPAMIQSSVNGIKVCAKFAEDHDMDFDETKWPIRSSAKGIYECPIGYAPCQESWLSNAKAIEFVFCNKDELDTEEAVCPITSFSFTLGMMNFPDAERYHLEKINSTIAKLCSLCRLIK